MLRAMGFKLPESVLVVVHTRALEVLLLERARQPGFWQSVTGSREAWDLDIAATARRGSPPWRSAPHPSPWS